MSYVEKRTKPMFRLFWLALLIALGVTWVTGLNHTGVAAARPRSESSFVHAAQVPSPEPACSQGSDKELAWCEFEKLANATSVWPMQPIPSTGIPEDSRPHWRNWQDKCQLLIGPCPEARQKTPATGLLPMEILATSHPVQLEIPSSVDLLKLRARISMDQGHDLASVLFSPAAAAEVQRLSNLDSLKSELARANAQGESGAGRDISDDGFDLKHHPNPTAIKLIWEVVLNKSTSFPASIYEDDGGNYSSPRYYRVDTDEGKPCKNRLTPPTMSSPASRPPVVPVNCFYHYGVDTNDPKIQQLLASSNQVFPANTTSMGPAQLILVGAHIIVLNPTHKLWQWITVYWTPDDNGNNRGWANPWRHYQMMTASTPKQGAPLVIDGGEVNIRKGAIANPYLEGQKGEMQSNCVSCHTLAEWSADGPKVQHATQLNDATPDYPDTVNQANKDGYFDTNSVRTHFLWSIANNPCLKQPGTPSALGCSLR